MSIYEHIWDDLNELEITAPSLEESRGYHALEALENVVKTVMGIVDSTSTNEVSSDAIGDATYLMKLHEHYPNIKLPLVVLSRYDSENSEKGTLYGSSDMEVYLYLGKGHITEGGKVRSCHIALTSGGSIVDTVSKCKQSKPDFSGTINNDRTQVMLKMFKFVNAESVFTEAGLKLAARNFIHKICRVILKTLNRTKK